MKISAEAVLKRHRRRVQSLHNPDPFHSLSFQLFPALLFLISQLAVIIFISIANIYCFHPDIVDRRVVIHHEEHEAVGSNINCSTTGVLADYDFIVDYLTDSR